MRFASFEVDVARRELLRDGRPVSVEPLVFDLIAYLARHTGRLVSRDELKRQLWGDTAVSYWALARLVKEARRAIGDHDAEPRLLETVRGRGFRLAAPVEQEPGPAEAEAHREGAAGSEAAIEFALRAAAHAAQRQLHGEAAHHLRAALKLRGEDDLGLQLELGEQLVLAHDLDEGRALLWRTAERAEAAGLSELFARAALAYCGVEESPFPDARRTALLERALEALPARATQDRIRLQSRLARALCLSATPEQREELSQRVLADARVSGRDDLYWEALAAAHLGAWTPDNLDQREAWAREQLELARRLEDPLRVHDARMDLVADLLERGDRPGVARLLEEHHRDTARSPNLLFEWHAAHYTCLAALLDHRFEEAERALERARALGEQTGYEIAAAWHAAQLYTLFMQRGRLGELAPAVKAFAASQALPAWEVAAALAAAEAGETQEAHDVARHYVVRGRVELPRDFTWLTSTVLLLEVCRRAGLAEAETAVRRALEPYSDRHVSLYAMSSWGPVSGFLG